MNENAGQFRSAAIGGFHRQDVLDYIERMTQENREQTAAFERMLEEETAGRARAEEKLSRSEERAAQAEEAKTALEKELAQVKARLEKKTAALDEAEACIKDLRRQVSELEPGAESWQRIKDTAGDIEVAAHERAQITMQEAHVRAAEVHAEAVRWVLDIQGRCDKLQQDLRSAIIAAETELDSVRGSFSQAERDMEGFQQALSDLVTESETEIGAR